MLGDWLALLLFVVLGQADHAMLGLAALPSLLITSVSLILPWTAAAYLLGAYAYSPRLRWPVWLGRALTAWLVAAPLGLMLRAFLRGQATIIVVFMAVAMTLGGLMLLAWRALYYWLRGRSREE